MQITYLTRKVNNNVRYLDIRLEKTLFVNLFLVSLIFGSVKNKKPTGIKKKTFDNKLDATEYIKQYIIKKIKKGYK